MLDQELLEVSAVEVLPQDGGELDAAGHQLPSPVDQQADSGGVPGADQVQTVNQARPPIPAPTSSMLTASLL